MLLKFYEKMFLRQPYTVKYCIQKDILRILSSSFTIFNINGITFEEENYFDAQILKTTLKM